MHLRFSGHLVDNNFMNQLPEERAKQFRADVEALPDYLTVKLEEGMIETVGRNLRPSTSLKQSVSVVLDKDLYESSNRWLPDWRGESILSKDGFFSRLPFFRQRREAQKMQIREHLMSVALSYYAATIKADVEKWQSWKKDQFWDL